MNKWISITVTSIVFIMLILIAGLDQNPSELNKTEFNLKPFDYSSTSTKPVVLIIVDSIMDEPLQNAIQSGEAEAIKYLIEKGKYYPKVVSSYPTMSVTIDSSILTGKYADQHQVPGLVWYNDKEKRVITYGSGMKEIWKHGIYHMILDSLKYLNDKHLNPNVKTIYETLSTKEIDSASINGLIYRGIKTQTLFLPNTFSQFSKLPDKINVKAPTFFSFGSMSQMNPNNQNHHVWQKFGLNDQYSTNELLFLMNNDILPPFSMVYFPNNDQVVHKKGVDETEGIKKVDEQLQRILNSYPTWDDAIKKVNWIILGDSGQSKIGKDKDKNLIRLKSLLNKYQIYELGSEVKEHDQILLSVNERMAYIYVLDDNISLQKIAEQIKEDSRIDFVAWKDEKSVHVLSPDHQGSLSFESNNMIQDMYAQFWSVEGNLEILDLVLRDNQLQYQTYPDALARLYGALHSHQGRFLVADAKIEYEFTDEYSPIHLGGAGHGSLHADDSFVPMIITGTNSFPKYTRIIDIKDWILQLMGIETSNK
ncbi:alkaline phosphatase family protein [Chengkuizengella sediminis]|uniref:alkaline phosphatase family protein n=1 Tax=Chengkuizengella sediminis TaxID=1885917 RepID=UPI0013895658|nr:alkaline phosphatase family protein [Chengkuizengella sediminis]NDI33798.1 alkaline phosphatase family protein [Chengkuizengella sediminis]